MNANSGCQKPNLRFHSHSVTTQIFFGSTEFIRCCWPTK